MRNALYGEWQPKIKSGWTNWCCRWKIYKHVRKARASNQKVVLLLAYLVLHLISLKKWRYMSEGQLEAFPPDLDGVESRVDVWSRPHPKTPCQSENTALPDVNDHATQETAIELPVPVTVNASWSARLSNLSKRSEKTTITVYLKTWYEIGLRRLEEHVNGYLVLTAKPWQK